MSLKKWKTCVNVESDVYHAVFTNGNCPNARENDRGDYFVCKNHCEKCPHHINKKEEKVK